MQGLLAPELGIHHHDGDLTEVQLRDTDEYQDQSGPGVCAACQPLGNERAFGLVFPGKIPPTTLPVGGRL